jgi:hypothetical protein
MNRVVVSGVAAAVTFLVAIQSPAKEIRVRIELVEVHCGNTEDVMGADHFYVVSALSGGAKDNSNSAITKPIKINDKQTKRFPDDQRVMFDAKVPAKGKIVGGMKAYDEDYAKDWKKQKAAAGKATKAIAGLVGFAGPNGKTAGAVLLAAFEVYSGLASMDRDDHLGTIVLNIPADGPANENKKWRMKVRGIGISTWDYTVTYRIVRTK